MADVKFSCPHCQQHLQTPEEYLGQTFECPSCKGRIQLQAPQQQIVEENPPPPPAPALPPQVNTQQPSPAAGKTVFKKRTTGPLQRKQPVAATQQNNKPDDAGFFAPEKKGIQGGVLGGIAMMAIAAIWFFVGLAAGYIFFYPPILFIIGLYGFIKGLVTGNIAGK